jgi:hypothetical protein
VNDRVDGRTSVVEAAKSDGLPVPASRAETDTAAWTVRDFDECGVAAVAILGRAEVRTVDLTTAEGGTAVAAVTPSRIGHRAKAGSRALDFGGGRRSRAAQSWARTTVKLRHRRRRVPRQIPDLDPGRLIHFGT